MRGSLCGSSPFSKLRRAPSTNDFTHLYSSESTFPTALLVYQNANLSLNEPEIVQLLYKARCVIPAVRNYLFFHASRVAVVYFGKRVTAHGKEGIKEGAEDFKVKIIRFLTSEIWPPLLRTDAPDESLGTELMDTVSKKCAGGNDETTRELASARLAAEAMQESEWVKKSLETSMEVLVYLKRAENNSKYLKVILHNNTHRIHFDIIDPKEEKFRWEGRKLFTRIMDNLESQKAVDSYESYSSYFREACEMASRHSDELEQPTQPRLKAIVWTTEVPLVPQPQIFSLFHSNVSQEDEKIPHSISSFASQENVEPHFELGVPALDGSPTESDEDSSPEGDAEENRSEDIDTSTSFIGMSRYIEISSWMSSPQDVSPVLSRPLSPLLRSGPFSVFPSTRVSVAESVHFEVSPGRYYEWMSSLEKPESATLDYKSYMSHPAEEIIQRSVKFICGFLNAYREGKLVIGVHEILRKNVLSPSATLASEEKKEGKNQLVLHNDLIDQFVVGVRISETELAEVQRSVSEQLLNCIPPIPPAIVHVELVPTRFPETTAFSQRILVLYDFHGPTISTQDAIKQKCNSAIRFLHTLGLSIVPMELSTEECEELLFKQANVDSKLCDSLTVEIFLIAAIHDASALENSEWEAALLRALGPSGKRCNFFIANSPGKVHRLPEVHVVEISVDMKRCTYAPLRRYKGKFFSGWPTIPIWDEITERVRPYPRNYHLWEAEFGVQNTSFANSIGENTVPTMYSQDLAPENATSVAAECKSSFFTRPEEKRKTPQKAVSATPTASPFVTPALSSVAEPAVPPINIVSFPLTTIKEHGVDKQPSPWDWYKKIHLVQRILRFLFYSCRLECLLTFRLIHPLWNSVFEMLLGTDVIKMIFRTPVGNPMLAMEWKTISRLQSSLLLSGLPPVPLLLCRVYELLGNLPSPFPYVPVPLQQQNFRLSPHLISLFYYQSYFDGTMRISVVLDLRDSLVKLVQLRCGVLTLNCVAGVGFELMSNYKLITQERPSPVPQNSRCPALQKHLLETKKNPSHFTPHLHSKDASHGFTSSNASNHIALSSSPKSHLHSLHDVWAERSTVKSFHRRELCNAAQREVERSIPLLSFQFIGWNEFLDRNSPSLNGSFSLNRALPSPSSRPWSLLTLLNWFRSVLMDPKHVNNFGYGNRCFAFKFLRIEDICATHFQAGVLTRLKSDGITFSSEENCLLHRRQEKWRELPWYERGL